MRRTLVYLSLFYSILLVSCSENKNSSNTSLQNDSLFSESEVSIPEEIKSDTLPSGKGTKSTTPADPGTGTSTSENGLSTDVGGTPSGQKELRKK